MQVNKLLNLGIGFVHFFVLIGDKEPYILANVRKELQ